MINVVLFGAVVMGVYVLHLLTEFLKVRHVDPFFYQGVHGVEYGFFILDLIAFAYFFVKEFVGLFRRFKMIFWPLTQTP